MRYNRFRIRGYKGIKKDIIIDLEKHSLIPLIGINECGKTTILEAILAFDRFNDDLNAGRHLENIENMYSTLDNEIKVEAKTQIDFGELVRLIDELENDIIEELKSISNEIKQKEYGRKLESLKSYRDYFVEINKNQKGEPIEIYIGRDLKTKDYYFLSQERLDNEALNNELASELMRFLPYTLYFDDFRDRLDEKIEIPGVDEDASDWIKIIDKLFKSTNKSYSIYDLPIKNENIRRSILSEVEIKLNDELTREWPHFSIQNQPLDIKISYSSFGKKNYIEFFIVEKIVIDGKERERYFKVQDRSKGFYWYFNFIMKLIFNTKSRTVNNSDTIYLLDEPGSYLHSTAQFRLTKRLKDISKRSKIIYCTHSPYLLDPQIIPLNSILVVEKDLEGSIDVKSVFETKGKINKKNSAFQPIFDALDIRPILMDYDLDNVILVEGMYDYLSFEMFKGNSKLNFFPCTNADSILNNISYMIFLKKNYLAIWDHDNEGKEQRKRAEKYFGEIESKKFNCIPLIGNKRKSRLENIYDKDELISYKTNFGLARNISFEKVIIHLFYSEKRNLNISKFFPATNTQFISIVTDFESQLFRNKS